MFWTGAADLAGSIAVIVAAANGNIPLTANQITTLATNLGAFLVAAPPTISEGCDVESRTDNVLTTGTTGTSKVLKPNIPIRLTCSSFSNLGVWGKRNWLSYARIHSSFKINGAIKGGLIGHDEDYCCTKTVGNWVAASNEDPNRLTEFLQLVGIDFSSFFWGLPTYPSGAILIEREFGYITQNATPHTFCNVISINPTHQFDGGSDGRNSINSLEEGSRFEIHDVMGRLLFAGKASGLSKSNMPQFIMENNLVAGTGIYVVSLYNPDGRESWKIFLQ